MSDRRRPSIFAVVMFVLLTLMMLALAVARFAEGNLDGAAAWLSMAGVNCLWHEMSYRRAGS